MKVCSIRYTTALFTIYPTKQTNKHAIVYDSNTLSMESEPNQKEGAAPPISLHGTTYRCLSALDSSYL